MNLLDRYFLLKSPFVNWSSPPYSYLCFFSKFSSVTFLTNQFFRKSVIHHEKAALFQYFISMLFLRCRAFVLCGIFVTPIISDLGIFLKLKNKKLIPKKRRLRAPKAKIYPNRERLHAFRYCWEFGAFIFNLLLLNTSLFQSETA